MHPLVVKHQVLMRLCGFLLGDNGASTRPGRTSYKLTWLVDYYAVKSRVNQLARHDRRYLISILIVETETTYSIRMKSSWDHPLSRRPTDTRYRLLRNAYDQNGRSVTDSRNQTRHHDGYYEMLYTIPGSYSKRHQLIFCLSWVRSAVYCDVNVEHRTNH